MSIRYGWDIHLCEPEYSATWFLWYHNWNGLVRSSQSQAWLLQKTFECIDGEGNLRIVRGIPKVISIRQISAMQLKKFCRKGCRLYATHVLEAMENETPRLEGFHVLWEFRDVFLDQIPRLSPKRDIYFTIDLVPGAAPVSKTPYRMSTPEFL